MRDKKVLLIALVLSLAAAFAIYSYLNGVGAGVSSVETSDVVIAIKPIEKKSVILPEDVKTEKVPKSAVNANSFTDINEVIGKRASEKIIVGEQVLRDRLQMEERPDLLSYAVPKGRRAVSINVDEAAEVADFIRPGDFVDILVIFGEKETGTVKYPQVSKVILQNILILGMGQQQDVPAAPRTDLPKTVTLAVTLEEAEKLALAEQSGVIRMALRNVDDHDAVPTTGIIRQDIAPLKGVQ